MYIYTDDDLTRINRDYLGPKGRRIPWVASYRTYGVAMTIAVIEFFAFMALDIPFSKWTVLLYFVCVALTIPFVLRRLNGDVSLLAMFRQGWQEVSVPRSDPKPKTLRVELKVGRFDYNAEPRPRWWQLRARKAWTAKETNNQAKRDRSKQ